MVKDETLRIESRFLEPACGDGNFLIEILKRKLAVVEKEYAQSQREYEFYFVIAPGQFMALSCNMTMYWLVVSDFVNLLKNLTACYFPETANDAVISRSAYLLNIVQGNALNVLCR